MRDIWFWQQMVSPHMMGLAVGLARKGCQITYVAGEPMSADRIALGWQVPNHAGVELKFATANNSVRVLVDSADPQSIHLCEGVRANGSVSIAQRLLAGRRLQQWVVMETVDDAGMKGILKRLEYARLFRGRRHAIAGVLAIGHRTTAWVVERGMPVERVFPFAYFLPRNSGANVAAPEVATRPFRFIYVGQFTAIKRLDLLVSALATLATTDFELWVVGNGPLENALRAQAQTALPGRVRWIGRRQASEVPGIIAEVDCLVLPSSHDGWGVVVSEALMAGTPAICSESCGSAGVVRASGVGGVFPTNDAQRLRALLAQALRGGVVGPSQRASIAASGYALGVGAGADYLLQVIDGDHPLPPWEIATGQVATGQSATREGVA